MARLLLVLLAALCVLGWTSPAATATPTANHNKSVAGVILKVDDAKQVFVLKTKSGHRVAVKVTDKTKIAVDGAPATFADLAKGQKARVGGKKVPSKKLFIARHVLAKN